MYYSVRYTMLITTRCVPDFEYRKPTLKNWSVDQVSPIAQQCKWWSSNRNVMPHESVVAPCLDNQACFISTEKGCQLTTILPWFVPLKFEDNNVYIHSCTFVMMIWHRNRICSLFATWDYCACHKDKIVRLEFLDSKMQVPWGTP